MHLDMAGAFDRPVELTVPVGVYVDGELAEESSVHISGTRMCSKTTALTASSPLNI